MDAVSLPLAFLAGVVSFASPCFLPVVPVFIAYLVGRPQPAPRGRARVAAMALAAPGPADSVVTQPGERADGDASGRRTALLHAGIFVASFSAIFVAMWALISLIGWAIGDLRPALRVGGGIVLILLGLYAVGLLKVPVLDRTLRAQPRLGDRRGPSMRRSAAMGLAFGAGWSPCIGPVLGVILGMSLARDSAVAGLALLVVYCLGLGTPFMLLSFGATWVTRRLRWFSRNYRAIQVVSGVLLLAMGFLLIADLLAPLSGIVWISV